MENLGGWENTDHPDFDPNLLNVESWGVDHNAEDTIPQHDANNRNRIRKKSAGSWGDNQWSTVTDFDQPSEDNAPPAIKEEPNTNPLSTSAATAASNPATRSIHGVVGIPNETVEAAVEAAVAAISETSDSVGDRSGGSSENNNNNNNNNINNKLQKSKLIRQ